MEKADLLDVIYNGPGNYCIQDRKYGWVLCNVSFSVDAQGVLDGKTLADLLKKFAEDASEKLTV